MEFAEFFDIQLYRKHGGMSDHSHQPPRSDMSDRRLATVTVERPRCPKCGSATLRKYRSLRDQGDGSALWWVRCSCGLRFRVVLE